ncbi:MAG: chlorobactene glucosyltransferase [Phycisphaerales bacterium]|nr:chlorobactene glucosyltransferase [Phycisphaerales bacterium]
MSAPTHILLAASPALISYVIVGPLAWMLFAALMALSYGRMNRFRRPRLPLPATPPQVTILVPAKDEGDGIRACLERVLAQDYPNFSVLAVDDRSTDATGAIMDELAAAHPDRLRALHIPPDGLPPGWLGKCNALHTAAAHASGEWLLFVDSDVKIEPDALSTAIARVLNREYDALSIMTRLECDSFWEKLILPLAAGSVGALTLMSLTNHDKLPGIAFANGQFFLIRRSAYEEVGGHESVRDNITEDVALMRNLKRAGKRCRLYYGRDFASTRMHTTLGSMFSGWSRIYSGVTRRRALPIVAAMMFVAICGLSAYIVLALSLAAFATGRGRSAWLLASLIHVTVMTLTLMAIYRMSGNQKRYALAFPLGGAVMLAMYGAAVRACRTGKIAWRGTSYTAGSATSSPPAPVASRPAVSPAVEQELP